MNPIPSALRRFPRPFAVLRQLGAIAFFTAAGLTAGFAANTWYVAPTGSDSNAGTLAAPFASVTKAQASATAGDTVYIRGGTYSTFSIAATDSNYNYVHQLNKANMTYAAYPGETPVFNFASVPTNLRVCGFYVTGTNITIRGFTVTGTPVGAQKQSECFRIFGSTASCAFYDCVARDNAANGFYYANGSTGSCTNCDAYNNIGPTSDSIGNTDGFGAHAAGVVFRYCRSWHNSDDGYDCLTSTGSNTFDHCFAYNMTAGGDSNGFKIGGYAAGAVPASIPTHIVTYCLSANNNAHGFYANHHPGKSATWTHNTAYNNNAGNFDMLERTLQPIPTDIGTAANDIPGYREILHANIAHDTLAAGAKNLTSFDAVNTPPANVTNNSWNIGATVNDADFLSVDSSQMTLPRYGGLIPFISFMHLAAGSDLAGLGCFDPPPGAPANLTATWVTSSQVNVAWTAGAGATKYLVKRATTPGGPYALLATGVTTTNYSDAGLVAGTTYYYLVTAMNDISFDESAGNSEADAAFPMVAISGIADDTGRSAADAITSDPTITLFGVAGVGDSVAVTRVGTGVVGTVIADGAGHWSFDYTGTVLPQGSQVFRVTATEAGSGTPYTSDNFTVTVDTTAPAAPVILSAGSDPLVISGTTEPFGLVAVTLDGSIAVGSAVATAAGDWQIGYASAVAPGQHTFTALVADIAGNISGASPDFTVDTSVVTPAILSALTDSGSVNSGALSSDKTITLTGTAGAGDTVTVTRVGQGVIGATTADGSGLWTFDYTGTALPEGSSVFTATGTHDGSTSSASLAFALAIDSVAPAVTASNRQNPAPATVTSAITSLIYRVTFSESVVGVDAGDFTVTGTGGATGLVAGVSAVSPTVYDVTVDTLSGVGTLRLDLNAAGTAIADPTGNLAAGYAAGQTYTRVISVAGSGTWINTAAGLWSDAANWLDATIPSASTHGANFNTLDLTDDVTVHLDSARTVNSLTFGDTDPSSAAGWLIDHNGIPANTLTLAGTSPTITVNALGGTSVAAISARLAGTGGLTKQGAGTLALSGANTISGGWSVLAGGVRLDAGGSLTASTVNASSTGTQVVLNGGSLTASGLSTLGSVGGGITLLSGTAALNGGVSIASDSGTLRVKGGTLTAGALATVRSSSTPDNYAAGYIFEGGTSTVTTVTLGTGNSYGSLSVEGGALTASGSIVVGSQTTGGRGGYMRVTSGTFTSTDTANGLVLSRLNGTNANNVATATFSGGVSTIEKIMFGQASSVTAGAGTVNLTGGTLYLGSGGIVKNGTSGMVTTINLGTGTLGAKANWSTTHPIVLSPAGTINVKAANAADAPFNIALSGVISGSGNFTKTGAGTLTLSGANSYSGSATVAQGTLQAGAANTLPDASALTVAGGSAGATGTLSLTTFSDTIGALTLGGATATSGAAVSTTTGTLTLGGDVTYNATNQPLGATLSGLVALNANRTFTIGDSATAANDLTVSAVISGTGFGFTKSGAGVLALTGANTFTGNVGVGAGTLSVTGSLAAGGAVTVDNGGTLAGTGTINKAVNLNNGGVIAPAGAATGTLSGDSLTWNGGGKIAADLGATSDRLTLTGALTKGAAGTYGFVLSGTPAIGTVHTLASFGSTTFSAADFSASGVAGTFAISGTSLLFTVAAPPDAAFNAWAASLPPGQQGATADPEGDGLPNLLEFVLGLDGNAVNADDSTVLVVSAGGQDYPAIAYTRRIDRGGVTVNVLVSTSLDFSSPLGAVEVSVTPAAAGFETVITRSAVPLVTQPRQFFRLSTSL